MRVATNLLLLAVCVSSGVHNSGEKQKDGGTSKKAVFNLANIVTFHLKMLKLRNKVAEQLKLSPGRKVELEKRLKKIVPFKSDHIQPMGDTIEEVNKNNGIANYLYQDDILLTRAQAEEIAAQMKGAITSTRSKRQAYYDVFYPFTIWEKGVDYFFDSSVDDRIKTVFRKAAEGWSNNTCIDFREKSTAESLRIVGKRGCASFVGKVSVGIQDLYLGSGCESVATASHELGHTLGLFHTQSRHDRDKFVIINEDNIVPSAVVNFKMESTETNNNYEAPYDYGDIMHYPEYSDAINQSIPTIVAMDPNFAKTMGSPIISFTELFVINKHYGCDAKCDQSSAAVCKNGGFPHPRNCSKCVCPSGYGGTLCDERPSGCGSVLNATESPQTFNDTVGNPKIGYSRDDVDMCNYWIKAPTGSKIEVEIMDISKGFSIAGCSYGGVEIKAQADQRITGYRFCVPEDVGTKVISNHHILPIIVYNRYKAITTSLRYRIAPSP